MGITKLPLHKRLHHWEDNGDGTYSVPATGNIDIRTTKSALVAIADEIESDYIPKAVDANGYVWNIGDECICAGKKAHVMGFDSSGNVFVYCEGDTDYTHCAGSCIKRPEERTAIEKVRDEIKDCAEFRELITYSLLDGWVKDLTAYIDQQGKDE